MILNWNGKHYLEQFLPSVLSSTYGNYKVIVADNGSTDDSIQFMRSKYPGIRLLMNSQNEGFAKGYNTALKQVEADYYVLLNSDVEVTPGWIEPVIEFMELDHSIAVCQPKILSFCNRKLFEYAGASGGWMDVFAYPFNRGRVFDICEVDNGQYDDPVQVFWASGAAFFVRSEMFHHCNGFDDYFFAHQEEIDLCWRMQHAGFKIYVQPASVVYHVGGGTLPMGSKRKVFLNFRNNLVMFSKNIPVSQSFWKIPIRMMLDNVAGARALFAGDATTVLAIWKAHWHYLGWLFFKRSQSVFPVSRLIKPFGVYKGSVVWAYFIRNRRRFSEIVKKVSRY